MPLLLTSHHLHLTVTFQDLWAQLDPLVKDIKVLQALSALLAPLDMASLEAKVLLALLATTEWLDQLVLPD